MLSWLMVGCVYQWQDWRIPVVRASVQVHKGRYHRDHRTHNSSQAKCIQKDQTREYNKTGHNLQCPEQHRWDSDAQHVLCPSTVHGMSLSPQSLSLHYQCVCGVIRIYCSSVFIDFLGILHTWIIFSNILWIKVFSLILFYKSKS